MISEQEKWLLFLNAESEEDYEELRKIGSPIIQKAIQAIYDMSDDPEIQELVRIRKKALDDEESSLKQTEAEDVSEGETAITKTDGITGEQIDEILSSDNTKE